MNLAVEADQESPKELEELALSAGADPVVFLTGSLAHPNPKFFIGQGKIDELKMLVDHHNAQVVIFNHALSPAQERNIEREIQSRVLDRTGLILDIFAQRARTHEGKLQVELAQLDHMSTRLVRGWTHLERQKGGIGLRGPGETQLETDRRLLRARMKSINKRLEKVRKQRDQGRRSRKRAEVPTLSLVGYTNAGKSTLFNNLTTSEVYAADTVGFIRHLPHKLVEAFRATLQETIEATLLLHVIDGHDDDRHDHIAEVEHVLSEIGAEDVPVLEVYNKIDLLDGRKARIDRDEDGKPVRVWLSAVTGEGHELLFQAVNELLADDVFHDDVALLPAEGQFRARLYENGAVVSEKIDEQGSIILEVRIQKKDMLQILSLLGMSQERCFPREVCPY